MQLKNDGLKKLTCEVCMPAKQFQRNTVVRICRY